MVMRDFAPLPDDTQVRMRPRIFLGLDPAAGYVPRWAGDRDGCGMVGPPGYGKTSGLIVPQLLYWDGPAVSVTTRGDVLRATGDHRASLAATRGGDVHVYDPLRSEGVPSMPWSPLMGCEDPGVCYRRVAEMTAAVGAGMTDGDHWRAGAADILRAIFHAAALDDRPLSTARSWLATQEVAKPVAILDKAKKTSPAAAMWADDLSGKQTLGERERGSFYSVAIQTLEATAEPTALASTVGDDFNIDNFLTTKSTLYILGPSHYQQVLAPLIAGLVGAIAERAAELAATHPDGRLRDRLLLSLDEVSNIAPLRGLSQLLSEGGGRGIHTVWATQTLDRLRARYGDAEAAAILGASGAKLFFGGLDNSYDLRMLSEWEGEIREASATVFTGPTETATGPGGDLPDGSGARRTVTDRRDSGRQQSVSTIYRPRLPVDVIRRQPPGGALLWHGSDPVLPVETRPAGLVPAFASLAGYTPPTEVET